MLSIYKYDILVDLSIVFFYSTLYKIIKIERSYTSELGDFLVLMHVISIKK